jgi:cytochrome c biogenesis protein CcdA
MFSVAPAAVLGFVVGLRHAMDVDHVAAVGTIVARERNLRGAALIGAAWGLGHTLSLLVLGGAIVAFGLVVPQRVGLMLELGVGLMLLALGVWNFVSRSRGAASHPAGPSPAPATQPSSLRRALGPLVVGGVHGLAGSAAAALLVVATVRSASWGIAYLLVFGLGTMLGMVMLTTALALPIGRALQRSRRAEPWMRVASGAVSLVIGAAVVYQIGFRDGLFLQ